MKRHTKHTVVLLSLAFGGCISAEGLAPGDKVQVTLRGVPQEDQTQVNGAYKVSEGGAIRMPGLADAVPALGLSGDQLARKIEAAYRQGEIYTKPAIEIEILRGGDKDDEITTINVGGFVQRAGPVPFRKGMKLLDAIQGAGDRNDFGGARIELRRDGKLHKLDFRSEEAKNFYIEPNDNIRVLERGILE